MQCIFLCVCVSVCLCVCVTARACHVPVNVVSRASSPIAYPDAAHADGAAECRHGRPERGRRRRRRRLDVRLAGRLPAQRRPARRRQNARAHRARSVQLGALSALAAHAPLVFRRLGGVRAQLFARLRPRSRLVRTTAPPEPLDQERIRFGLQSEYTHTLTLAPPMARVNTTTNVQWHRRSTTSRRPAPIEDAIALIHQETLAQLASRTLPPK